MTKAIVVINSGSTSLKFAAYSAEATASPVVICGGEVDSMAERAAFPGA